MPRLGAGLAYTPRVFLQPAGGPDAVTHYEKTVRTPVPLRKCAEFLSAMDIAELAACYGRDGARVWGVTPGESAQNRGKWERMRSGDAVLFCGGGRVFAKSFVCHKAHSKELAIALWGADSEGATWEFVYFVTPPLPADTAYLRLAGLLGYSPSFVVRGFMALDSNQSERIWRDLGLATD